MGKDRTLEIIKTEIEKQRKFIEGMFIEGDNSFYDGQDDAYNNILSFLSTLESEKPMEEGLEDEIERYLPKIPENPYNEELRVFARYFAQWGAEHLKK